MRSNQKCFLRIVLFSCILLPLLVYKNDIIWLRISTMVATTDTRYVADGGKAEYRFPQPKLQQCQTVSPLLVGASTPVNLTAPTWEELEHSIENVLPGGLYTPPNCIALQSVVLVIPYRDREEHLRILLRHIHPFLQRQQAQYAVLVVEETKTPLFNKGVTINIGFLEAMKGFNPDCVIIHDVDQLPKDDRNTYRCEEHAVHLAVHMSQYRSKLRYNGFFGGAIALKPSHFQKANGYSTAFYGWGKEDDDMLLRLNVTGVGFTRDNRTQVTRYASLEHERDTEFVRNPGNTALFRFRRDERPADFMKEGLNTTRYTVTETIIHPLYTHIKAEAETPLTGYSHATDAIPCTDGVTSRSKASLVDCARDCNEEGDRCRGFVYDFNEDILPKYTCRLIGKVCKSTRVSETLRFFPKIVETQNSMA